jgi:hypothetical protein
MDKNEPKIEKLSSEQLGKVISSSEKWLTINETEKGLEVRMRNPDSLILLGELLENDRDLFKTICNYIKLVDEDAKAKLN